MGILRPVTEGQVNISLSSDCGELYYRDAFLSSTEIRVELKDQAVIYDPVVVKSVFDPEHYKDLLNYCIEKIGTKPEQSFSLEIRIRSLDGKSDLAHFRATGCRIVGFSLPKFDRESGQVASFQLTLQPSGVSSILT